MKKSLFPKFHSIPILGFMYDHVGFIAPIESLVYEIFCENCSHFILKWFQHYEEVCFLITDQGWIKCGSGEHRSQVMTRKIEEIVTLEYEEKEKKEKRKRRKRGGKKEEVEIEEFSEEKEEHSDDKLI